MIGLLVRGYQLGDGTPGWNSPDDIVVSWSSARQWHARLKRTAWQVNITRRHIRISSAGRQLGNGMPGWNGLLGKSFTASGFQRRCEPKVFKLLESSFLLWQSESWLTLHVNMGWFPPHWHLCLYGQVSWVNLQRLSLLLYRMHNPVSIVKPSGVLLEPFPTPFSPLDWPSLQLFSM